jgi:hypothetical protein
MVNAVDSALPPFADAWYVTVPLPVPDAPPVTFTQLTGLVAVQEHQLEAVTPTDPLPPVAGNACPPDARA